MKEITLAECALLQRIPIEWDSMPVVCCFDEVRELASLGLVELQMRHVDNEEQWRCRLSPNLIFDPRFLRYEFNLKHNEPSDHTDIEQVPEQNQGA